MLRRLSAIALMLMGLSAIVYAQDDKPIRIPRTPAEYEQIVSKYGDVRSSVTPLMITSQEGVVARLPKNFLTTVQKVRFHFLVRRPASNNTWQVQIVDKNNSTLWQHTPTSDKFWSPEIILMTDSRNMEILVFSPDAPIGTLDLVIDRIVTTSDPGKPQSISADGNQLTPIAQASNEIKSWGKLVARLLFISDVDNNQYVCTGFLVSPTLLLTNNHCIQSQSEMESAIAEFDYDTEGGARQTVTFSRLLATDPDLDFSLLRLERSPSETRTPLRFDISPLNNRAPLVIVQHPAGQAKQFSKLGCKVSGAQRPGVTPVLTDFGHECDTLGGSSGSLVVKNGSIVGLHHLGFNANSTVLVNRAVNIKLILDKLRSLPEYSEIANAPPRNP